MKKVAIVGRPNVGKSTLFNRIIGFRKSITDDSSGITRDRIYAIAEWLHQKFSIVDTGGIILKDEPFSVSIKYQAEIAINESDVIIFVCDIRNGVTHEDLDVARILQKAKKPVIVCCNKADDQTLSLNYYEFYELGFDTIIPVSSIHGIGIGDLLDKVLFYLKAAENRSVPEKVLSLAIIGQPNSGKSTLVNKLLNEERMIVSNIPNTTRDAVDSFFKYKKQNFKIIDTAGINKHQFLDVERYSLMRVEMALDTCDVAVLMIDASKKITELDKKISGLIKEKEKPIIVCFNKWDLMKKMTTKDEVIKNFKDAFLFLNYSVNLFISALTGEGVKLILDEALLIYERLFQKLKVQTLTSVFKTAIYLNPPAEQKGTRLKVSYVLQLKTFPPTFVVVGNQDSAHFTYLRYLENTIREQFDFRGVPVKIVFRKKESDEY